MNEELDQIEKNDTWELIPMPRNNNVIGTKWVFRNKLNEYGHVIVIKQDWYVRDTLRLKVSILKRHFPRFPEWKKSYLSSPMHAPIILKCIIWM
jgi:hypothetical protein